MRIAAVHDNEAHSAEDALNALARSLQESGHHVVGAVQHTVPASSGTNKRMDLHLIPGGEIVTISASLPPGSPGCVLDPDLFETVSHKVCSRIGDGFDIAILSKFGLRETEGRGFRDAIVRVVEHGIPLVIGVSPLRLSAFEDFLGATPDLLPADPDALQSWFEAAQT